MKKKLIGILTVLVITFSSCSIFVRTKHHEVGAGVSTSSNIAPKDSLKTAGSTTPGEK
jgi:hypothetical protein